MSPSLKVQKTLNLFVNLLTTECTSKVTISQSDLLSPPNIHTALICGYCMATLGRGLSRGQIGLATMDLARPELSLSWFTDTGLYFKTITKLMIYQVSEATFSHTMFTCNKFMPIFP